MSDGTISCKFWTLQKKIYAIALTVIAIGGAGALIIAGGNKIIDPHISVVAERVDSANHIPIMKEIASIKNTSDSTNRNVAVILSILNVMATNDQLIKAKTEREGGLWK
jgi:heptaprenylglyceryl phosphate synthase